MVDRVWHYWSRGGAGLRDPWDLTAGQAASPDSSFYKPEVGVVTLCDSACDSGLCDISHWGLFPLSFIAPCRGWLSTKVLTASSFPSSVIRQGFSLR